MSDVSDAMQRQRLAAAVSHIDPATLELSEKYDPNTVSWFWRKIDANWCLSNMAGHMPIDWEGSLWSSSEQLYQACKYSSGITSVPASRANDPTVKPSVRKRIYAASGPGGAKMTQKCADKEGIRRDDWKGQAIRIHAMLWVLELKLQSNPTTFGDALLATKDRPIVEVSSRDTYWGCVREVNGALRGRNVLGKLLTDVRIRLESILAGQLTYRVGFLLP